MARRLKPQANSLYGMPSPLTNLDLIPVVYPRAPTTADRGFSVGQLWYDSVGTTEYVLTSVGGGIATWTAITAAAGAVFSLTDETAAARIPLAGTITISGDGVNITTSGAANEIIINESATPTFTSVETGAISITTGGAADTAGLATLVPAVGGGTVTVATTAVTASSLIFTSVMTLGGAALPQALKIENVVAATSFDITSADALDSSTVSWMIVEPV